MPLTTRSTERRHPLPDYEPSPFVEPLGYQPVEFLDIPLMCASPPQVSPRHVYTQAGALDPLSGRV